MLLLGPVKVKTPDPMLNHVRSETRPVRRETTWKKMYAAQGLALSSALMRSDECSVKKTVPVISAQECSPILSQVNEPICLELSLLGLALRFSLLQDSQALHQPLHVQLQLSLLVCLHHELLVHLGKTTASIL